MKDFYELFEAGKKLGKGVSELIESLSDLEPSGKVFLDCSGSKMRSGVSNWLGVSIIDGVEKDSMAMPGKPAPLTKRSLMDLKGRINDDESGINLLRGLEVTLMTNWGPTKKAVLDEEGEPLLDSHGSYVTESLSEEEIESKRIEIEFTIRFNARLQGIINRPPNPVLLIHQYDLERLTDQSEIGPLQNTPPEGYADKGRVTPEGIDKKSPLSNFFLDLRTPHTAWISEIDFSCVNSSRAWKDFKESAKESMGVQYQEIYGFPPVYLKLDSRDPKNVILFKYESFDGPNDPGEGSITKKAFSEAFRRQKNSSKST